MATTRLGQIGIGVEPYGTFQPKDAAPDTDPHNPGLITRLGQFGIGLAKYGVFQPKSEAAPEPEPTGQVESVGGGGLSWQDYVTAEYRRKHLKEELEKQEKQLKKVEKQIRSAEKKVAQKRTEGILANLQRLEFKKDEIEHKIQALEIEMIPLEMFLEAEIDDDDEEWMLLQ